MVIGLILGLLVQVTAVAAPPEVDLQFTEGERALDYLRSVRHLDLETEMYRKITDPVHLRDGPIEVVLTDGYLIPIFSGRFNGDWERNHERYLRQLLDADPTAKVPSRENRGTRKLVGFVFTKATGKAKVTFPDRADAQKFANQQVLFGGIDKDHAAKYAKEGEYWQPGIEEGIILGLDERWERMFMGHKDYKKKDLYDITVYGEHPEGALARARKLFLDRRIVWDRAFQRHNLLPVPMEDLIAADRLSQKLGLIERRGDVLLMDLHLTERTGLLVNLALGDSPLDKWVSLLRDRTGSRNSRFESELVAFGTMPDGQVDMRHISGTLFEPENEADPLAAPQVEIGWRPKHVDHMMRFHAAVGKATKVMNKSRMVLTATGRDQAWVDLRIPAVRAFRLPYKIVSVTMGEDESPLIFQGLSDPYDRLGSTTGNGDLNFQQNNQNSSLQSNLSDIGLAETMTIAQPTTSSVPGLGGGIAGEQSMLQSENEGPVSNIFGDVAFESEPIDPFAEFQRREIQIRVFLNRVVKQDEEIMLNLSWFDHWQFGRAGDSYESDEGLEVSIGSDSSVSIAVRPVPLVVGAGYSEDWTVRYDIQVPDRANYDVAMLGGATSPIDLGEYRRIQSHSPVPIRRGIVAFGKYSTTYAPPARGMPAIRTTMHQLYGGEQKGMEVYARQVINFYDGWLPAYPWPDYEFFEAANESFNSSHGMLGLNRTSQAAGGINQEGEYRGHFEEYMFSRSVAEQWWESLARLRHPSDQWITGALSTGYATHYLAQAYQDIDECLRIRNRSRKQAEAVVREKRYRGLGVTTDLTRYMQMNDQQARFTHDDYSSYVMFEMLRPRIGTGHFYWALDRVLADINDEKSLTHLTTERLEAYLADAAVVSGEVDEQHGVSTAESIGAPYTTKKQVEDFFDFWIHNGYRPKIKVKYTEQDGKYVGTVTSDIPFGTFELPLHVVPPKKVDAYDKVTWVEVVDGEGSFTIDAVEDWKLKVDPNHRIIHKGPISVNQSGVASAEN